MMEITSLLLRLVVCDTLSFSRKQKNIKIQLPRSALSASEGARQGGKKTRFSPPPRGVMVAMMHDINSRPTPIASDVPATRTEGGVMRTSQEGWRHGGRGREAERARDVFIL